MGGFIILHSLYYVILCENLRHALSSSRVFTPPDQFAEPSRRRKTCQLDSWPDTGIMPQSVSVEVRRIYCMPLEFDPQKTAWF